MGVGGFCGEWNGVGVVECVCVYVRGGGKLAETRSAKSGTLTLFYGARQPCVQRERGPEREDGQRCGAQSSASGRVHADGARKQR